MEKPDANGYVYVTWPSKSIPHGGIFHTRVVEPSHDREQFLKVLLDESKLNIVLREKANLEKRHEEEKQSMQAARSRCDMYLVRPKTSRRRSLSAIKESGIYELDDYKPLKRGEDREKLKERLANSMAYGSEPMQPPPPPPRIPKMKPKLPTAKEQWSDLLTQIRERVEWLAEMEDLGQAEPHRDIIKEQIEERLRLMDALGVESQCSSARSNFSTTRSREVVTARSKESAAKTVRTPHSITQEKQKSTRTTAKGPTPTPKKKTGKDENVSAYEKLSPLQYSPRRRQ